MSDISESAMFYAGKSGKTKTFHIETDGAIVNITVGLADREGHLITRVDVTPDDASRGGDGNGRMWVRPEGDARIIRLHDWEKAPGMPKDCKCAEDTVRLGVEEPLTPDLMTDSACGRSWCARCTPTPAARCPFEYDHEETAR